MKPDHERVTKLLTDTITLLCKNGLSYDKTIQIQGLVAVTIDSSDIVVIQMNDTFTCTSEDRQQSVAVSSDVESQSSVTLDRLISNSNNSQIARKRPASTDIVDLTRLVETPDAFNLSQNQQRRQDVLRPMRSELLSVRPDNFLNNRRASMLPPKIPSSTSSRLVSRNMPLSFHPSPLPPDYWSSNSNGSVCRSQLNCSSQSRCMQSQMPLVSNYSSTSRMPDEMGHISTSSLDTRFSMQSCFNNDTYMDSNNSSNHNSNNRRINNVNANRLPPTSLERSGYLDPNQISNIMEYERLCGLGALQSQQPHLTTDNICPDNNLFYHRQIQPISTQQQPDSIGALPVLNKPRRSSRSRPTEQHVNLCNDEDDVDGNTIHNNDILRDAVLHEISWVKLFMASRSFAVYGPMMWNSLPKELRRNEIEEAVFRKKTQSNL
ncbi:hypothetical protein HELRODRAFT_171759 [Helobdella robusta]|uniref:Uncharacterized protein n=1 Tax=Helobdella robusta TaxID=6412 RepID=T1F4L9_HELRO|nr:hypothetical protein HELRODRAFT_171759 [Helobdella robusta]ESO05367.1 hypothetical protein HELRODRAFT_171759 [Helobdella robusta]